MADPLTDNQLAEVRERINAALAAGVRPSLADSHALCDAIEANAERLGARVKELEDAAHLCQSRMGEAVEFWRRQTGAGDEDHSPGLGDLLAFLLREIEDRGKDGKLIDQRGYQPRRGPDDPGEVPDLASAVEEPSPPPVPYITGCTAVRGMVGEQPIPPPPSTPPPANVVTKKFPFEP